MSSTSFQCLLTPIFETHGTIQMLLLLLLLLLLSKQKIKKCTELPTFGELGSPSHYDVDLCQTLGQVVSWYVQLYGHNSHPTNMELSHSNSGILQSDLRMLVIYKQEVKVCWYKAASPPHTDGSVGFATWRQCAAIYRKPKNGCHGNVP